MHKAHKENIELEKLTNQLIGMAIEVHKELGPGLLESAYKECLCHLLKSEGYFVEKEKPMPLVFKEIHLDCGYRLDLLVEKSLVIEIKAVESLNEIHLAQVLTYLKLGGFKLGLLLNFNVSLLKNGIVRVIN